jgi:hypothetical protein
VLAEMDGAVVVLAEEVAALVEEVAEEVVAHRPMVVVIRWWILARPSIQQVPRLIFQRIRCHRI